ncbi:DnaB-like helicase C-terminal domain-containing protein [Lysinibacillus sp. NPDC098008]|uniref:DnaB-like helicase C-terminal domain-containing protein n=1 Tax=Lysinibacillus sp. NPDC098008 TaxID=3364146 RepID=UPI0038173338
MSRAYLIERAKRMVPLLPYIEKLTGKSAITIGENKFMKPCPFCQKDKKHHFAIDTTANLYKSFNECVPSGSIIDFMMHYEHLSQSEAIEKLINLANLTTEWEETKMPNEKVKKETPQNVDTAETKVQLNNVDFTDLVVKAHRNVDKTAYFKERGLSDDIIHQYKLGYVTEGFNFVIENHSDVNEKPSDKFNYYKCILPIWNAEGKCSYFISRIEKNDGIDSVTKTHNLSGRTMELLNERYLMDGKSREVIFIVEGYFDALSIEDIHYPAIALNGVNNVNRLKRLVEMYHEQLDATQFIVIPDNDTAGEKLIENMRKTTIEFDVLQLPKQYKDANEFFVADKNGFTQFVQEGADKLLNAKRGDFLSNYLDDFYFMIEDNEFQPISTGMNGFDTILGGGLFPGLYVLGGPTSLGKTAFIHQIADQIATAGTPVYYFSFEMSRNELIARSISRLSFLANPAKAMTVTDITTGTDIGAISFHLNEYKQIAQRFEIFEGRLNDTVKKIEERIDAIGKYQKNFVVIIDYLQVINAKNTSTIGERSTIDTVVTSLKQISRKFNIPIVLISAFNRSAYYAPTSFEGFKESGVIEYTADVLMGLQFRNLPQIVNQKDDFKKKEIIESFKLKNPREITLQVLKNRFGDASAQLHLQYFAKYNYFRCV